MDSGKHPVESLELPNRDAIIYCKDNRRRTRIRINNNMIPEPSSEYRPDLESAESSADFPELNKAQEAWKSTEQYARENPVPVILLTLAVGVLLGALLSRRKPKHKDAVEAAKELLESAYEQLAEIISQLARIKFGK
jgi:hypothetical protein